MHFKKVCFAVILVLLAQIIVMKKLDRTKNKKQPSTSYRAYARKNTKRSSFVSTQAHRPKFHAHAIRSESLHKKKSYPDVSSTSRNKSTTKKEKSTSIASNGKRKRAIATDTSSTKKPKTNSEKTTKQKSTIASNSVTKSKSSSTDPSSAIVSNSSESTPITKDSSTILTTSTSPVSSINSAPSTSSNVSSSSSSSASSTLSNVSSSSSSSSSSASSTLSNVSSSSSSTLSSSSSISPTPSIKSIEETVTVTVEAEDKNELANTCYGKRKVSFTQYWIPIENQWDEDNDGERVYLGENEKVDIFDKNGKSLAIIPKSMHRKCKMEGTCLLENGDILNIDNTTDSFIRVGGRGRETNVFGLGSGSQNLVPFISVASNDLPYGQKLYIKQLDGVDLGKGRTHNGCVRVDDDGWSFKGCHIDFFVLTYIDYLWLNLDLDHVNVKLDDCKLKNYVLKDDMSAIKATNKIEIIPSLMEAKYVQYVE